MNNRDFIDDDLTPTRPVNKSSASGPLKPDLSPPDEQDRDAQPEIPALVRHRNQIDENSAVATEELERLRRKEEELQRRKRELEESRRKHDDYIKGKEELLSRLSQSLVGIERHEIRTDQTLQLLSSTRVRFRELLEMLRALREDDWPESEMQMRLTEALAMLENARMEYNKATARVEAELGGSERERDPDAAKPMIFDEGDLAGHAAERSFWEWMGIGFAFSLPLILVLGVLGLFWILHLMGLI